MIELTQHFASGHIVELALAAVLLIAAAGFRDYGRRLERQTREQSGRHSLNP